jgi:hypothetical protein
MQAELQAQYENYVDPTVLEEEAAAEAEAAEAAEGEGDDSVEGTDSEGESGAKEDEA